MNRLKLFNNKNYFIICLSGLLTMFAQSFFYISLSWKVYDIYNSIYGNLIMMFLIWIPTIILSPLYGYSSDKGNKKLIITFTLILRGLCVFLLVLSSTNNNIFLLCGCIGLLLGFYMPSIIPLITITIPKDNFVEANSLVDMIYEMGTILGVGISGFFIAYYGADITLIISSSLFIISGICFYFFQYKITKTNIQKQEKGKVINNFINVIKYIQKSNDLIIVYIMQIFIQFILSIIPIFLVSYVKEVLNENSNTFAILEGVYSLGILIGCLFIPYLNKNFKYKTLSLLLILLMSINLYLMSINLYLIEAVIVYFFIGFSLCNWALTLSKSQELTLLKYQGTLNSFVNAISGTMTLFTYCLLFFYQSILNVKTIYSFISIISFIIFLFCLNINKYRKEIHI